MTGTALILGANGRFGRNAAEAFRNRGWRVTRFDRRTDDLMTAAEGKDVIVNAWNPPYPQWETQVPGLTQQVIAAARDSGATVLLPGNVYVFGEAAPELMGVETPHRATNPLGRVRVEMEDAYRVSGVRTIVLRAGDFLDTEPSGNWFDKVIAAGLSKGRFSYPGNPDIPHAWAWLPDVTEAAVRLAERRDALEPFADIPFPGYTLTGRELAAACEDALDRPVKLARMSWLPLHVARPVWPMAKHLIEMRYLWDMPHRIDPEPFRRLLPEFGDTPLEQAVARALSAQVHPDQTVPGASRLAA